MEKNNKMKSALILFLCSLVYLSACKQEAEPIDYGHDICLQCKMTILDKRFAAEIVTSKGKVFKFDDIGCLLKYSTEQNTPDSTWMIFVADYSNVDKPFIDARQAVYLHSEVFKSPMNGNYAAFARTEDIRQLNDSLHIELLKWENLYQ